MHSRLFWYCSRRGESNRRADGLRVYRNGTEHQGQFLFHFGTTVHSNLRIPITLTLHASKNHMHAYCLLQIYIYTITRLNQQPFIPLISRLNCMHANCITILLSHFFLIYAGETLILIIGCTIKRGFATNFTSEYLNVYFF